MGATGALFVTCVVLWSLVWAMPLVNCRTGRVRTNCTATVDCGSAGPDVQAEVSLTPANANDTTCAGSPGLVFVARLNWLRTRIVSPRTYATYCVVAVVCSIAYLLLLLCYLHLYCILADSRHHQRQRQQLESALPSLDIPARPLVSVSAGEFRDSGDC